MCRVGHDEAAGVTAAGDAEGDPRFHGALPRARRRRRRQRSRRHQHGGPRAGPPRALRALPLAERPVTHPVRLSDWSKGGAAGGGSRETTTINRAGRARAHGGHARPATAPAEAPARAGEGWGSLGGGSQSTANHLPIRANQARPARPRPTEAEAARQRALRRRVLAPRARIGRVRRGGKGANGGARSGAGAERG